VALLVCCSFSTPARSRGGHLFYVDQRGDLRDLELTVDGRPGKDRLIAPRTHEPDRAQHVKDLRISATGRWVAWSERAVYFSGQPPVYTDAGYQFPGEPASDEESERVASSHLLDRVTGRVQDFTGLGDPIGFADEDLLLWRPPDLLTTVRGGKIAEQAGKFPRDEEIAHAAVPGGALALATDGSVTGQPAKRLDRIGSLGTVNTVVSLPASEATAGQEPVFDSFVDVWTDRTGEYAVTERGDRAGLCGSATPSRLVFVNVLAGRVTGTAAPPHGMPDESRLLDFRPTGPRSGTAVWVRCSPQDAGHMKIATSAWRIEGSAWSRLKDGAIAAVPIDEHTAVVQPGSLDHDPGTGEEEIVRRLSGPALFVGEGGPRRLPLSAVNLQWTGG
jgi:hypothetical protein